LKRISKLIIDSQNLLFSKLFLWIVFFIYFFKLIFYGLNSIFRIKFPKIDYLIVCHIHNLFFSICDRLNCVAKHVVNLTAMFSLKIFITRTYISKISYECKISLSEIVIHYVFLVIIFLCYGTRVSWLK
jgi:hypothetical protein